MPLLSRRAFLKQIPSIAAALTVLAPHSGGLSAECAPSQKPSPVATDPGKKKKGRVRVAVQEVSSCQDLRPPTPPDNLCVLAGTLAATISNASEEIHLKRHGASHILEAAADPGEYLLDVSLDGYPPVKRQITVAPGLVPVSVFVGREGWPSFMLGGVEVPFKPNDGWMAVVFRGTPPGDWYLKQRLDNLNSLGLELLVPPDAQSYWGAHGTVLFLKAKEGRPPVFGKGSEPALLKQVRTTFADRPVRIGMPFRTAPGNVRIIDSQYTIRFRKDLAEPTKKQLLDTEGATIVQQYGQPVDAWVIEFSDGNNYPRHLQVVYTWTKNSLLVFGEPNIIFEATDAISPTSDPWYGCQCHLDIQSIPAAWDSLESFQPGLKYGSPAIAVATFDRGLDLQPVNLHKEIDLDHLAYCHDMQNQAACCTSLADSHGLLVYGIVSAKTDNAYGMTGIATHTRHIAVRRESADDGIRYAAALLWLAKIPGAAAPPHAANLQQRADIINLSHHFCQLPLPTVVQEALCTLTTQGRDNKGTIIVCAAGNEGCDLQGFNMLATSPYTIAVGNTRAMPGGAAAATTSGNCPVQPLETRDPVSNFGPWLDICANAQSAPALYPSNLWVDTCAAAPADAAHQSGIRRDAGNTSLATPMISAAAALVLSVYPELHWNEVRDVLCGTADKIDLSAAANWQHSDLGSSNGWRPLAAGETPTSGFPTPGLDYRSDWYGYGRLNLDAAVKEANSRRPAGAATAPVTGPALTGLPLSCPP